MDWIVVSSFVAGIIFSIVIVFLACVLFQTTIENRYTKIAYFELMFAVSLRVAVCYLYGTGEIVGWEGTLNKC